MCVSCFWSWLSINSSNVIALCALILTVWQAIVARKHNKLSVTPYLTTWTHVDTDKCSYAVEILNNGIGPALIKSFQIFVDGHEIKGQDLEILQKALKIAFPQYSYHSYNSFLSEGYMMSPKESRNLLTIQFLGPNFPSKEEIDHAAKRVKIIIEYESIYEEKYAFDSSKFEVLN